MAKATEKKKAKTGQKNTTNNDNKNLTSIVTSCRGDEYVLSTTTAQTGC